MGEEKTDNAKETGSFSQVGKITRRTFAKLLIIASGVLASTPLLAAAEFLFSPRSTNGKYPRRRIANQSQLAQGEALVFAYPRGDRPAILLHLQPGTYQTGNHWEGTGEVVIDSERFVAYDAVCTHLGCQLGWMAEEKKMGPSCHGARFSPVDGTVLAGPPPRPLPKIRLEVDDNGDVYATGYEGGLPLYGED